MTTASVDRMHVRWRLAGADDEPRRAALLASLLVDALPDALDALGVGAHGEVCVRRVVAPAVVVEAGQSDDEVVARWASRVASAIADAVRTDDVIVFRSVHHALADMALAVARGDLARAWAWRAVGIWPIDLPLPDPDAEPAPALALAPPAVSPPAAARTTDPAPSSVTPSPFSAPLPAIAPEVAVPSSAGGVPPGPSAAQAALPAPAAPATAALAPPGSAPSAPPTRIPDPTPATASFDTGGDGEPNPYAMSSGQGGEALAAALLARPEAIAAVLRHVEHAGALSALEARLHPGHLAALHAAAPRRRPARHAPPGRRHDEPVPEAWTAWGGLLLLLHLVDPGDEAPTEAALHALGTSILSPLLDEHERLSPRDPALLAFCGLAPDEDPPEPETEPADPAPLLQALHGLGLDAAAVCRRPAVVTADPGWFGVQFSLDDVDVAIRRVGLDLDPGWLPWLGAVVRFTYA